ncbi:MAG: DUF1559 domain-containing protein [Planctomycetota bacterium]|nr:MAG: DUF1559 domain-containing protein [Planctomycetota bacterium]REK17486.1 MAG: DUF1559 domain-containing protein [Planctomycetota bacterium]REK42424.1 MAG: DUF1559 domain-containing protein [Planctomycetota bacterium]
MKTRSLGRARRLDARRLNLRRLAGFTLVELLIVLAVIGVLLAIVLPAVMGVLESARLTKCQSKLREIGIALVAHHNVHARFPAGCKDTTRDAKYGYVKWPPKPPHRELAWNVYLLPFMGHEELYDQLDRNKPFNDPANKEVAATELDIFLCPSAERTPDPPGQTDYAGINGEQITGPGSPNISAGVLVHDESYSDADVKDGTSQTLIVAEDTRGPDKTWIHGRNIFAQMWGINDPQGEGDNEIRSDHVAGAVGLFADGHVVFLSDDLELKTLAAMITRAGRERFTYDP